MRLTKKNFLFMVWIVALYYMAYVAIVGSLWLMVAIFYYCFVWPVKKIIQLVKGNHEAPPVPAQTVSAARPTVTMKGPGGIFVTGKPQRPEVILSPDEQAAANIILNELIKSGVDIQAIHYERTQEYLKIVAHKYFIFCRLALHVVPRYFSLTVSAKDRKSLDAESRFTGINVDDKRFLRIPINSVDDIRHFSDLINPAFAWATTNLADYQ